MKNNFFAILLSLIISIGCTQETVINANIDEKLNNSGPTLKVQIKTENSRTIRPEVTKWEIKLFELNGTNEEILATRVLHGKDNTVTTFTNVTVGNYTVKVTGKSEDDGNILFGEEDVIVEANKVNIYNIKMKDCLENDETTGNGSLNVSISGLGELGIQEDFNFTLEMSGLTNPNNPQTVTLSYKDGVLSGVGDNILSGSYKIENISFVHTDALPTGEAGDSAAIDVLPINLIQDPIVNIYPDTTTYINWTWKYSKENQPGIKEEITQNNILKNTLVPVWNKPVFNPDYYQAESSVPAKNGSLSANALFAEPTWDEEKPYTFTVEVADSTSPTGGELINYSANIPASKLEFINCTYDESGDLWVLSGTAEMNVFFDDNNSALEQEYYCYVLKNVSTGDEYNVTTKRDEKISKDFAVATVGEQNKQKYLFYINDSEQIKSFKIEGEIVNIPNGNVLELGIGIDDYNVTALYVKDKKIYIAITVTNSGETGDNTTANIYTGIINEKGELASFGENNQPDPILSLGISDFIDGTNQDVYFYNSAFAISDMYINEDKTKLYVTAGCVCYNSNSWNNNQDNGFYHSFGGLFVYDITEEDPILSSKYGIYSGDNENNLFANYNPDSNPTIMQAENEKSSYFAGPRYIIPAGKDLLIVDSGFYGVYFGEIKGLINCEKRNRIFTFDGSTLSAPIKLSDSISFDYDYLVNSDVIE